MNATDNSQLVETTDERMKVTGRIGACGFIRSVMRARSGDRRSGRATNLSRPHISVLLLCRSCTERSKLPSKNNQGGSNGEEPGEPRPPS